MTLLRKIVLAAPAALFVALVACADDEPRPPPASDSPPRGSTSGSGGASGGPSGSDAGPRDGASDAPKTDAPTTGPQLCDGLVQKGASVSETVVASDPPPPLGGTIPDGTYVLTEMTEHSASGDAGAPSGRIGRGTLVVKDNTLAFLGARGTEGAALPADVATGFTFTANGTSLGTTSVCPVSGTAGALPYSAVGSGLSFQVDPTHRETYTRQ
jgi:hypothetical protein